MLAVLPEQTGGAPWWLMLPDAAAEAVTQLVASTGRLASVKIADTPRPAPVSLRRVGLAGSLG
ncbi:MAG: hypothetical protein ABL892_10240 [Thiobacillaceae bacterium]